LNEIDAIFTPGVLVRNLDRPEWGIGQVQSNIGGRITVNFPDEGKVVMESMRVNLELVSV
jgi:hypothetical protein